MNGLPGTTTMPRPTLLAHIQIARFDHWVKNVFVLPGIVLAMSVDGQSLTIALLSRIALGLLSVGLIASSNYVINELLDAPLDRQHPTKCRRPVPAGEINIPLAYAQWIVLMLLGLSLALTISAPFAGTMLVLWLMGCIYNIRPIRTKELPILDVLSEAVNNPLRLLAGWFIVVATLIPPASFLLSYWMVGCYFMAIKRFAELRDIRDRRIAASYRKSFAFYTPERLLVFITFYGAAAMLFFGAFTVRYRLEMILSYPLVALVMAVYFRIGFREHSAAQAPEKLYREPLLMISVLACAIVMAAALFVDIPLLHDVFAPTVPTVNGPAL